MDGFILNISNSIFDMGIQLQGVIYILSGQITLRIRPVPSIQCFLRVATLRAIFASYQFPCEY